ncbi:EpsG family protein [Lysobacter sp. S4-A87]|uniref:EpsG family protein n=1 Tax=Lysobacter sp. S4-A87 TaxID=2925843 RepID=UPI001F52FD37|nr:EpsG family protein [Lysobacter sp. S4-A87]UNK49951.1 EpsG family protein [Lysobacter sp. S4-A87]
MSSIDHLTTLPLRSRRTADTVGASVLSALLLLAVAAFGCWLVGTRSPEIGTDTLTYAGFFEGLGRESIETRLEPGFVYLSIALWKLGAGVTGYQTALFALMLGTVAVSTRQYFRSLGDERGHLTFLGVSLMLLYISPMFVNASINAVRQGLAALLVFTALLSFQQRRWGMFALFGAIAGSLHMSSLLYLVFAPVLLLGPRTQRLVAVAGFILYVTGLSMAMVRAAVPALYELVMTYTENSYYRSGVRIDFAVFSIFWYALPHALSPLVKPEFREKIKSSTAIYLVMLLPFFAVGWGFFSNRYLLPAWLSASLIVAAVICHSRLPALRHPLLLRFGLVLSCVVFYYFVNHEIVI